MSLDATEVKLIKSGAVVIDKEGIMITGFDGSKGCSCRDVAVLAMSFAIRELQRELDATIRKPGGNGRAGIG